MSLETILAIIIAIFEFVLLVLQWKERSRIKDREKVWYRDTQSLVNAISLMKNDINNNKYQDAKELESGISALGTSAHGIFQSLKDELKIRD